MPATKYVCSRCASRYDFRNKCFLCGINTEELCSHCGNAMANCAFVDCKRIKIGGKGMSSRVKPKTRAKVR